MYRMSRQRPERPLLALLTVNFILYLTYIHRYHLGNEPLTLHLIDFAQASVLGFFVYGLYRALSSVLLHFPARNTECRKPDTDMIRPKPVIKFSERLIPFEPRLSLRRSLRGGPHHDLPQPSEGLQEISDLSTLGSGKIITTFVKHPGHPLRAEDEMLQVRHPLQDSDMDNIKWSMGDLFRLQDGLHNDCKDWLSSWSPKAPAVEGFSMRKQAMQQSLQVVKAACELARKATQSEGLPSRIHEGKEEAVWCRLRPKSTPAKPKYYAAIQATEEYIQMQDEYNRLRDHAGKEFERVHKKFDELVELYEKELCKETSGDPVGFSRDTRSGGEDASILATAFTAVRPPEPPTFSCVPRKLDDGKQAAVTAPTENLDSGKRPKVFQEGIFRKGPSRFSWIKQAGMSTETETHEAPEASASGIRTPQSDHGSDKLLSGNYHMVTAADADNDSKGKDKATEESESD